VAVGKDLAFIIGTGRCGTTMLAGILNAHSKICVPHELQLIFEYGGNGPRLYELFLSKQQGAWNADDFARKIEELCPHDFKKYFNYHDFFFRQEYPIRDLSRLLSDLYREIAASRGKMFFLEQTPWYGQGIEILKGLFPDAKFIHMIRDGRDVALSFSRTPWWHDSPPENLERWQREITKISGDAELFLQKNQYLEVRYEDFVRDPEKALRDIVDFLGVPFEREMLMPENLIDYFAFRRSDTRVISSEGYNAWAAGKDSAVFTESVFSWRKRPGGTFPRLSSEVRFALSKWGYEA